MVKGLKRKTGHSGIPLILPGVYPWPYIDWSTSSLHFRFALNYVFIHHKWDCKQGQWWGGAQWWYSTTDFGRLVPISYSVLVDIQRVKNNFSITCPQFMQKACKNNIKKVIGNKMVFTT